MKKLLFICNQAQYRSPTAKKVFEKEYETECAGIYVTSPSEMEKLLDWADIVYVMEEKQKKFISENFPKQYLKKKIINLDIPDLYTYMDEKLVKVLREKV
ncbi:MAG: phosphotyrosine protein phosphatase [Candidatus Woesearchaeota archaeon]|jgi:predicted protein tyrosine phosphatase|nr:phosphotyrosine protein phosphatase [Candidatus Woesearchaeota archaeon]MDP6648365.1 phosphotyrosine protein phosphatase [Candidatus Woesearchaeota archaeon]|tara:strand:- start:484 stop:783 length:300 start_codon:yes stop_codon:yes gene_type:complete